LQYGNIENIIALRIHIEGLVQGVGFRPFVYRLARQYHLEGWVVNHTNGVSVKVQGPAAYLPLFMDDLRSKAPVVCQIDEITVDQDFPEELQGFLILASQDLTNETSEISPDIAVCTECLADMKGQPHRTDYPFVNCTNCGPRFSIIRDFPYDRKNTTMESFALCTACNDEYTDIADRRFHAQPVACRNCGPYYSMQIGGQIILNISEILDKIRQLICSGGIIAIKGSGGFHLMCNALDDVAVKRLRYLKRREGKPFAVMFRDVGSLKHYAEVSDTEEAALLSWRRPIVILREIHPMAQGITMGLNTLGAFLPYMPVHYQIFEKIDLPALVLTSGNLAGEPVIISNDDAITTLAPLTDAVITYNRDIYNRNDDSVVRIIAGKEHVFRRSRGYVPSPVRLGFDVHGILATGAELSFCFCLGKSDRAYLSQHIGDLTNQETFEFFEETLHRFQSIFRITPHTLATDLHPDYLSTRYARKLGLPLIGVQHHHAHIASCMAENGIDEPVIGLAFDGTGYGTDGNIWGSEFMVCDFSEFNRVGHFNYMPVPGGDRASKEPWRMGISLLYQTYGHDLYNLELPLLRQVDHSRIRTVVTALEKGINCPESSGAGRLFDAVAAITGICTMANFHAEGPMRLESFVMHNVNQCYDYNLTGTLSFLPAIKQICDDIGKGADVKIIAAKFHNTVADAAFQMARKIRSDTGLKKIVLSGGVFQNKYLVEVLENKLVKDNFAVHTHGKVPCNDGGLALGQLAVAARRKGQGTRDEGRGTSRV
jgi:hydrogenase maturation protein HypF